jgi:hypothetical protein
MSLLWYCYVLFPQKLLLIYKIIVFTCLIIYLRSCNRTQGLHEELKCLELWAVQNCCLMFVDQITTAFLHNLFFFRLNLPLYSFKHLAKYTVWVQCEFVNCYNQFPGHTLSILANFLYFLRAGVSLHLPLKVLYAFSTIVCT